MSTIDAFKAKITSSDFEAQGPVVGTIKVKVLVGSSTGSVEGTFKVKGGDIEESITAKVLGTTTTYDNIVVGGTAYSRTNGGDWNKAPASGQTIQAFVGSGIPITDEGVETKFGRQLHRLTVEDMSGVDPSAFGITAGSDQSNLAIDSLSFWAEEDGTPAGLSIQASLDQKIAFATAHETVTLDMSIDSLSGVTITAPTN